MIEILVHSGVLVAGVAVALLHACAAAFGESPGFAVVATVAAGTFGVYGFDRIVDDGVVRPARESFVAKHRRELLAASGLAVAIAVGFALSLRPASIALLTLVIGLALVHARLRRLPWIKPLYIAMAWMIVVVLLPAVESGVSWSRALAELLPVGLAIIANVIACDAADREAEALQIGPRTAWWIARFIALTGFSSGWVVPEAVAALSLVPGVLFVALIPLRPQPDHVPVLDLAIGLGALASLWLFAC